jgi:hypothetical protein
VEISAVILFLIIIGFLNLYITIPKKLKGFLSFLILNSVSIWLLHDLGWLKNIIIITSISKWLKTILKQKILTNYQGFFEAPVGFAGQLAGCRPSP